jgi:hypothetical protein
MSYIYEALKRAEDENARAAAGPRAVRRAAFFAARSRWWLWVGIGVLAANAGLLGTLVFVGGPRSPEVEVESGERAATTVAPGPDGARAREAAAPPPAPAPVAVAVVPPPAPPPPAKTATRPAPPAPRAPAAATPPKPVAPSQVSTPPAVARETAVAAPPVPAAPAVPAAPVSPSPMPVPAPSPAIPSPASPPAARTTPTTPPAAAPQAAPDTPRLQVQVVVYSDVPAQRMVFIDGRRYAEGDRIDADTVVERITPEGAVVSHRGQRLTLTSGRP